MPTGKLTSVVPGFLYSATRPGVVLCIASLPIAKRPRWPVTAGMFSEFGAFNVRQFGGEYFDEEGKKLLIDTPESRAGLEWIHSSIYKHLLIDDPNRKIEGAPLGLTGQRGLFAMGKLAMHNTTP
ncbi:MAG: hypothetical protein EB107_15205, partial [Proteobacteria bacterium]|nr:hypothetical protein [Pseudomonadota bacterium]